MSSRIAVLLWHYAGASLRRVTWLVSVEQREPHLPSPFKLAFQCAVDCFTILAIAGILFRAAKQKRRADECRGSSSRSLNPPLTPLSANYSPLPGWSPLPQHSPIPAQRATSPLGRRAAGADPAVGGLTPEGEEIYLELLRSNGYMVWRDPDTGFVRAVHGGDFGSASRVCAAFLVAMGVIIAALLCMDAGIAGLGSGGRIGCWTTLEELAAGGNGSNIPMEGDKLLLSCPAGCGDRLNREPGIGGKGYHGPLPLWGWTDVFGGEDGVYAPSSSLCRAAVHAGLAYSQVSTCFSLKAAPPLSFYRGSTRNGVASFSLDLSDRPEEERVMVSAKLQRTPAICPFSLYRYAACILVPIVVALALLAPPPFLFWVGTASVAYWFEAFLGADPWDVQGAEDPFGGGRSPWLGFLSLLAFTPGVYLMGPAYVIRAPCWQRHLPHGRRHRGEGGLEPPRAAASVRDLLVRNVACFFIPVLVGCHAEASLPKTVVSRVSATFREDGLARGENDPVYLLTPFIIISALSVLKGLGYGRGADIVRYFWVAAALAACLWLCTVLLRGYKVLTLGHFWLVASLVPVTARDHHAAAAAQGVLLGMAIQCVYMGDGISPWTYASPPNY